jgi:hypothetical protein
VGAQLAQRRQRLKPEVTEPPRLTRLRIRCIAIPAGPPAAGVHPLSSPLFPLCHLSNSRTNRVNNCWRWCREQAVWQGWVKYKKGTPKFKKLQKEFVNVKESKHYNVYTDSTFFHDGHTGFSEITARAIARWPASFFSVPRARKRTSAITPADDMPGGPRVSGCAISEEILG